MRYNNATDGPVRAGVNVTRWHAGGEDGWIVWEARDRLCCDRVVIRADDRPHVYLGPLGPHLGDRGLCGCGRILSMQATMLQGDRGLVRAIERKGQE